MFSPKSRAAALLTIAGAAALGLLFHGRVPQDPAYHLFADTRPLAGIVNFGDVMSNLPFLIVGLYGLSRRRRLAQPECLGAYTALCLGVLLVSAGSAYYHHDPTTKTLLWDRLPMTVAFMALFSMLLEERVVKGARTLWPLLAAGAGTAVYWYWTETRGAGDLRPYALVQFLPIVLMPVILALYPRRYLRGSFLIGALVFYVGAKLCESADRRIYEALGLMSGHTIKHLLAGAATLCIIKAVPTKEDASC